jgi:hypothetical protein
MYGLPRAGKVANTCLLPTIGGRWIQRNQLTPGLFKQTTHSMIFALFVDDFLELIPRRLGPSSVHATPTLQYSDGYGGFQVLWNDP